MMATLLAVLLLAQQPDLTPAYVTRTSGEGIFALATPNGRWAIQMPADCTAIVPDAEVYISGPPDDDTTVLVAESGDSCGLASRQRVSDVPCFTRNGICDVSRDWSSAP